MDRDIAEIRMLLSTLERAMKTMYDLVMADNARLNQLEARLQKLEEGK